MVEPQQAVEVVVHSHWTWWEIIGSTVAAVVSGLAVDQVRRWRRRRREARFDA